MAALEQPSGSVTGHPEAGPHSAQRQQAHTAEAQPPRGGPLPRGTLTLLRAVRATNFPSPQTKKIIIKALAMARRKPGMTKMLASIHQTPATKSILIITLSRSQAS